MSDLYTSEYPELRPGETTVVEQDGHVVHITATSETGIHSGRTRFRVECRTCAEVIHPATTGPRFNLDMHVHNKPVTEGRVIPGQGRLLVDDPSEAKEATTPEERAAIEVLWSMPAPGGAIVSRGEGVLRGHYYVADVPAAPPPSFRQLSEEEIRERDAGWSSKPRKEDDK